MSAIYRNGIQYAGAYTSNPDLMNQYLTKAELATSWSNVDNTADEDKEVLYAATAGDADTCSTYTVEADVPADANFNDTTYTLTQNDHTITLTPSTGSPTSFTIPDNNTTYSSLSEFTNDVGFIDATTQNLTNYYKKSETLTKAQVDALVEAIPKLKIVVTDTLLIETPDTNTIYLLINSSGQAPNSCIEYIYLYDETTHTGNFERLGPITPNMSAYITKTAFDALLPAKGDTWGYDALTGALELRSGSTVLSVVNIETSGTKVKLGDVQGAAATTSFNTVTLTWTDPTDVVIDGVTVAEWAGTRVVRKVGSAPQNAGDGTIVVNSTTRNQYSSTGFEDTGLTYGQTVYYRFFPYTTESVATNGTSLNVTPARTIIPAVPTFSSTITYDGTLKTATFDNYDSTKMSVTGNTGTDAGTYTATFTPLPDYCWSDGTTTGKDVTWAIGKADGGCTLSANSVTLDGDHLTATVTVTNPTGEVTGVSSGDTSVATASYSNGTVTISNVNETSGTTSVTVSIAASSNYNAATATISVTASFIEIVTWHDGTDAQIVAMVEAADRGMIDLTEYWSVGDEREILLSKTNLWDSQGATLVLVAANTGDNDNTNPCYKYQYSSPVTGQRSYPSFIIQQKHVINEALKMNSGNTTEGAWNSCNMRSWCNAFYRNSLPSTIISIFKSVIVRTLDVYGTGAMQESDGDYFFIPTEKEVQGRATYSDNTEANEFPQWEHYTTSSNRTKSRWQGIYGGSAIWWLRSPHYSYFNSYCSVDGSGGARYNNANNDEYLAPCGCI